jgi:hypothetical protein
MKNLVSLLLFLITVSSTGGASALREAWSARYPTVKGDYRHNAMGVDAAGNVFVTGLGWSDWWIFTTMKYGRNGQQLWVAQDVPGQAVAIATDRAGNAYVAGHSNDRTNDYYSVVKYDSEGRRMWVSHLDSGLWGENALAIALDRAGNVYVTGTLDSRHYLTGKFDANGRLLWSRRYSEGFFNWAFALAVDDEGNSYVTGSSQSSYYQDYATVKYDPDGNELWVARYSEPGLVSIAFALALDGEGHVYVTGQSGFFDEQAEQTFSTGATLKYDSMGRLLWAAHYGAFLPSAINLDAARNVFVTGSSGGDYLTVKYGPDGTEAWARRFDGTGRQDEATGLAVDARGHVYVTGWSQTEVTFSEFGDLRYMRDFVTLEYDPAGNLQWLGRHNCPTNADDGAVGVKLDPVGSVIVAGNSWQNSFVPWSFLTVKYEGSPCRSITLLEARLKAATLTQRVQGSLSATLRAACAAFERDNARLGKFFLQRLQDQVRAHLQQMDPHLADELISAVDQIIAFAI